MTDLKRIVLIILALILMAIYAGVTRAQTFEEMLSTLGKCPTLSCPPPPPPPLSVCGQEGSFWINVLPTSLNPIRVYPKECGIYQDDAARLVKRCLFVDVWHYDAAGLLSETVSGSSDPRCLTEAQAVPEPGTVALAIGSLAFVALARRRRPRG